MRTSLRGSLLEIAERNLRRPDRATIAIFEAARVYQPGEGLPDEEEVVVGVAAGRRMDRWGLPTDQSLDFFDAKGYVEALLAALRVPAAYRAADAFGFLPGRCAEILVGDDDAGVVGQVHPSVLRAFDIDPERPLYLFELKLGRLLPYAASRPAYREVSRYEAVRRDLALIVDDGTPAAALQAAIAATPRVVSVRPFDEYRGAPLPAGKKSLAFALSFQAQDRTLTDEEVDRAIERLLRTLARDFDAARR
jgi:phenylalanyl-tRNA synthetase beta chain